MGLISTLWCLQFPFQLLYSASCFLLSTGAAGFKSYLKWHFQQVLCPECWSAFVFLVPYPLWETQLVFCNTPVRLVCLILLRVHLWELRTVATAIIYFLKFFVLIYVFLFLAVLGLCCYAQAFSVAAVGGFSLWWLLVKVVSLGAEGGPEGMQASVVAAYGLSCPETCGIFPTRIELVFPA